MKTSKIVSGFLAFALVLQLTSCKEDGNTTPSPSGTKYGTSLNLGNGTARTFVQMDANGNPTQIGVAISEAAMNGLPADGKELILELPAEGSKTPFKHVLFGYMPHGHEPAKVYDQPHFDVHFYHISNAERLTITDDKKAQLARDPEAAYLPSGHINGGPVPGMGVHWIDPTGDEFGGKVFTKTFIYGAYDGKIIFYEPMVTVAYLKATADQLIPIKQPQKVATAGYYPGAYRVRFNAAEKQYEILLDQLSMKQ